MVKCVERTQLGLVIDSEVARHGEIRAMQIRRWLVSVIFKYFFDLTDYRNPPGSSFAW